MNDERDYKALIVEMVDEIKSEYLLKVAYSFIHSIIKEERAGD